MKANELMIGELVRVSKDVCFKKGTIVKVRGIDADNVFAEKELKGSATCVAVNDPDRVTCGVWCDYLEPIPLTAEILEQNGFKLREGCTSAWDWHDGEKALMSAAIIPAPSDRRSLYMSQAALPVQRSARIVP